MMVSRGLVAAGVALSGWSGFSALGAPFAPQDRPNFVVVGRAGSPSGAVSVNPTDQDQALPDVWIGVRMSPVPAALAAHVGDAGLMIGNIATGSPADRAGLQQYDVMLRFNGQTVEEMKDLVDAVQAAGADSTVKIELLRGGKPLTVTVTTAKRSQGETAYKFEEPNADIQSMQMHGKMLRRDPNGNWLMEDFGQLNLPPNVMQHLPQMYFHHMPVPGGQGGAGGFGGPGMFQFKMGPGGAGQMGAPGDPFQILLGDMDEDDAGQVNVSINENGRSLSVRRDDEGAYTVEKMDDGKKESATYNSEEEFREGDPDGYARYRQMRGGPGHKIISVRPPAGKVQGLQRDFQQQLEQMIRESKQQVEDAQKLLDEARKESGNPAPAQQKMERKQRRGASQGQ